VPESTAGPRLTALVALLMGCFRQSKSRVTLFLKSFVQFDCSPGWIVKLQNQTTAALRPAYDELVQALRRQTYLPSSCEELYRHRAWLWTFLDHDGVEPTNNASERALCHPVIWRKLSFGTPSAAGSRFVETILTVLATCQQQHRNVLDFLQQSLAAHHHRRQGPSLRPNPPLPATA